MILNLLAMLLALQSTPPAASPEPSNSATCNFSARVLHLGPVFVPPNLSGTRPVVLDVTVDNTGRFLDAKIVRAAEHGFLNQAVLQTAKDADYAPGASNCKLIGGIVRVTINFENKQFDCDRDVTVVKEMAPAVPGDAWAGRPTGTERTATVRVSVGPDGKLTGARIAESTGIPVMDAAALAAAQQSTYLPRMVNCRPVAGDAYFKVSFFHNQ